MAKAWMPFYVADYLADTQHLSTKEHGAYVLLICHYWQHGGLPKDDRTLAIITRLSLHEFRTIKGKMNELFCDGWTHKRIDAEIARAEEISQKRADAASQRHSKPDANADANAELLQTQSQSQSQSPPQRESESNNNSGAGPPVDGWVGKVIRLTGDQVAQWGTAFANLDLPAELLSRDLWLAKQSAKARSAWFESTARYLTNRNAEAKAKSAKSYLPSRTKPLEFRPPAPKVSNEEWRKRREGGQ
jgi:uncharacterized protein YdaU (DUF1376 family)